MTAWATTAQMYAYLEQLTPDSETDTLLSGILNRATGVVRAALYPVDFAGYGSASTRRVFAYGTLTLTLPSYQSGSISSVTMGGSAVTDYTVQPDGSLYRAGGWGYSPTAGVLEPFSPYATGWVAGQGTEVVVTAAWGYGEPPDEIVEVVLEVAVNIWHSRANARFTDVVGITGASGDVGVGYEKGLTALQQMVIAATKARFAGGISL